MSLTLLSLSLSPSPSVRQASAQPPHRGRPGGAPGQLALAGQRALFWPTLLWRLADQQPVGGVGRPLLPEVSGTPVLNQEEAAQGFPNRTRENETIKSPPVPAHVSAMVPLKEGVLKEKRKIPIRSAPTTGRWPEVNKKYSGSVLQKRTECA